MKSGLIFFVMCFFFTSQTLLAQWQKVSLGLNMSGVSTRVLKLSDRVIAGSGDYLYYKLDTDTLWRPIQNDVFAVKKLTQKIIAKEDTIIAFSGVYSDTAIPVFMSFDKGINWSEKATGLTAYPGDIMFDSDSMYILNFYGLYSSADFGNTLHLYKKPPINHSFAFLAKIDNELFIARPPIPGHPNDTSFVGVVRTSDYGENWTTVRDGLNPNLTFLQSKDTVLYAGTNSGLYISRNKGNDWMPVLGLPNSYAQFFDYEGDTLIVCLNYHIYISLDNGENWNNISDEISMEIADRNAFPNGITIRKGIVYASTSRGIFSTNDLGLHWKKELFEGANPTILALEGFDSKLFAGTYNFGIFASENNGFAWARIDSNFSDNVVIAPAVSALTITDSAIFAIPFTSSFFYNADPETMQWKLITGGLPSTGWSRGITQYKNMYFLSHTNGLFRSQDGGENWSQQDSFFSAFKSKVYRDTLLVPTSESNIKYSTDGTTWKTYRSVARGSVINFWKNDDVEIMTGIYSVSLGSSVYYSLLSLNGGRTWDTLPHIVNDVYFNALEILAALENYGIAFSSDSGKNWTKQNEGIGSLDSKKSYRFVVIGDTIFAYSGNAIYKDALRNYITSVEEPTEIIHNYFYHYPPYPIPTSEKVQVKVYWGPDVELSENSIEIFTILGEKVSTPQNISIAKQTSSNGIITWDCRNMQQGAYVMKVRHGAATTAIKIILAR